MIFLRALYRKTDCLFHRVSCTYASISEKKCAIPFSIKFSNIRLENHSLFFYVTFRSSSLWKNLTVASFLEHPVHSSIKHISWVNLRLWPAKRDKLKMHSIFLIFFNEENEDWRKEDSAFFNFPLWRSIHRGVLWKKVFLKIFKNSQENTCVGMSYFQ